VNFRLRYIPKEVFDSKAVEAGQIKFYDVAYLNATPIVEDRTVKMEITNFVTDYTQDDIEEVEKSLKKNSSQVVIENGQIVKISKDKNGIIQKKEQLTKSWSDWIDYWAVDFNYEDKKEIIRVENDSGNIEEKWTGNYIFENEWQSFRSRKSNQLEFVSAPHTYEQPGRYKVMVKVIDILGVDTSQVFEVEVR
jgi:hypothetical protein